MAALDILEVGEGQLRTTDTDMGRIPVTLEKCHVLHPGPTRVGTCSWGDLLHRCPVPLGWGQRVAQEIKGSSPWSFLFEPILQDEVQQPKGLCPSAPLAQHGG